MVIIRLKMAQIIFHKKKNKMIISVVLTLKNIKTVSIFIFFYQYFLVIKVT